jgi:iron(III) transport system substrate-binding protein
MSHNRIVFVLLVLVMALAACVPAVTKTPAAIEAPIVMEAPAVAVNGKLVIYTGRSEPFIQPVIEAFKARYPNVDALLKSGRNSELANALFEEQANPQADVFISTELFTVQALAQKGVFQPYLPAGAERISAGFIAPDNSWTGLTRRVRVIMYNTDLVSPEEAPKSIFDLTDPKWQGQIAAAGSTNGSMQAQIAVMRQLLGEEATEAWLKGLLANEVTFFGGHTDVRKAVGAGEFKIGLVNHYYFYLQRAEGSQVGCVFPDQGAGQIGLISNATAAALIKGARNTPAAQAFLDFLISPEAQKLFAELNYEYPLIPDVALHPEVQPLDNFRLADVDVARAAQEFDATFDLIERIGLP